MGVTDGIQGGDFLREKWSHKVANLEKGSIRPRNDTHTLTQTHKRHSSDSLTLRHTIHTVKILRILKITIPRNGPHP